jgi:hypothetical protein
MGKLLFDSEIFILLIKNYVPSTSNFLYTIALTSLVEIPEGIWSSPNIFLILDDTYSNETITGLGSDILKFSARLLINLSASMVASSHCLHDPRSA